MSPLLSVQGVTVQYPVGKSGRLTAVDDVSLDLEAGRTLGLVGESGCGKSSLGRVIAGIRVPTAGRIVVDNCEMTPRRSKAEARAIQMVFQDPASALNPAISIGSMLEELVRVHGLAPDRESARDRAIAVLESVELPTALLDRRPDALSGGQRQRVGIARALILQPRVIVADEAVAALDSLVKKSVIRLLADVRDRLGVAIIFISHDLDVVRQLCDEIAVMYLGRIVERRSSSDLFDSPRHPYSKALLEARPHFGERLDVASPPALAGDPPSQMELTTGCSFAPRCQFAKDECRSTDPVEESFGGSSTVRCHFPLSR
jgi:oligopeptide/dipeptide ABC transporter ATP-binding protein